MRTLFLLSALTLGSSAHAASTASHSVTVVVSAINEIAVTGSALVLTIDSASAGGDPDPVSNSVSNDLEWTTNESSKKITVETSLSRNAFKLQVQASGATGGVAASTVTVSTIAQDLVTEIAKSTGGCDLAYTASATASDGTGSDIHTLTYTITAM